MFFHFKEKCNSHGKLDMQTKSMSMINYEEVYRAGNIKERKLVLNLIYLSSKYIEHRVITLFIFPSTTVANI